MKRRDFIVKCIAADEVNKMNFDILKNTLDLIVKEYHTPGVDCIVSKDHKEIFRYFAGFSDIENNVTVKGNELYFIFSMTKMLTCVSALQLVEQGKISLDDKVSKFLPEFQKMKISDSCVDVGNADKITRGESFGQSCTQSDKGYAKNAITIKHLFTMTAGLDYNLGSDAIKEALKNGQTSTRELVRAISKTVLGFEPGTKFRYSLCHDVLGAVIEVVSGMSLGNYMKENIFKPLGMENTFFGIANNKDRLPEFAKRYFIEEDGRITLWELECVYNLSDEYQSGGAGLVSCTEDYALFVDALACTGVGRTGNRILKQSTVELMRTNQFDKSLLESFNQLRRFGYGYGLGVRTHIDPEQSGSLSPIGEFGWDGAAGAFSLVDCENKISLVYFQHAHNWKLEIQNLLKNALYKSLGDE